MSITTPTIKRLKTGIEGLDDILNGGLPTNHVYLIEGNPGSGKTTLALQFLLEGVKNGERGLYVTLSETKIELREVAESHGWQLKDVNIHEMTVAEESLLPDGQYTFFHPSEVELGETMKSLIEEVERSKPVRVVFDSLSEMRLLARDPLRYRRQILGLKQFFVGKNSTVLLIDDLTSGDSDLKPQSLAHGVIRLEQLAPEYGSERRRLQIVKLRGVRYRGGFHDFNLTTGGLVVFPRLVAAEHRTKFKREMMSSGIDAFDKLLGGGLDRGSSNLLVGPAGVGKTSLATRFACAAAERGEKSALFIFDEVETTFRARSQALGMDVDKHVENGNITIQQVDPAEFSPGEFVARVRDAVEKRDCRVIIIDSLNGYLHAMPEEKYLVIQLHEMFAYLSQVGVLAILIVSQHGVTNQVAPNSELNVSYLADTAVHLRFFESSGRVRKAISVIKKRSSAHEDTIRELILKPGAIELGAPLKEFQGVLSGTPVYTGAAEGLMAKNNG